MKKMIMFLIMTFSFSLCVISCDSTSSDMKNSADASGGTSGVKTLSDQEKAAYSIAIINKGMQKISWTELDSLVSSSLAKASSDSSVKGVLDPSSVPLGTLYEAEDMKIDATLMIGWREGIGIGLKMNLKDYKITTNDGTETSVTGEIDMVIAYQSQFIIDQNIIIYADTPVDNQLLFKGGLMDGQKVGLDNLELAFNISEVNIGSPVVVKGTVLINDVPLYVDSEILEFLMNFI